MKRKIILVGGGGHCKVVISVLKNLEKYEIVGISDKMENFGKEVLGVPVICTDSELHTLREKGVNYAFVTVGSVGNPEIRVKLFRMIKTIGFRIPVIISPNSIIAEDVEIGEGTIVMPGAIVNPGVRIGKNVIINTGAIIEHDCRIGDHVHIAPGAVLSGEVSVGCCSHIGTGAKIIQGVFIGENTIIGAGAVVVRNVPSGVVAKGVPAKW